MSVVLKIGRVTCVNDPLGGDRIKVYIRKDSSTQKELGKTSRTNIAFKEYDYFEDSISGDWAFPLLPKTIQTKPKVGEAVFVFIPDGNVKENRYYIGPIISQPQFMQKADFNFENGGRATNLLKGEFNTKPLENIKNYGEDTEGSFPDNDTVALIGRRTEDIILKDKEINIRCGVRARAANAEGTDLKGECVFNKNNPTYIQLKYMNNNDGVINIVSDAVNIVSHGHNNLPEGINLKNQENMLSENDIVKLTNYLHKVPYGDILVKYLTNIRNAVETHTHPWADKPPHSDQSIITMGGDDYNKMLSDVLRIS